MSPDDARHSAKRKWWQEGQPNWEDLRIQAEVLVAAGAWHDAHRLLRFPLQNIWGTSNPEPASVVALGLFLTCCTHLDHRDHLRMGAVWIRSILTQSAQLPPNARAFAIYHAARAAAEDGCYPEAREILAGLSLIESDVSSPWARAYALMVRTRIEVRTGDLQAANAAGLEATVVAERSGSDVLLADSLVNLGGVARFQRRYDAAQKLYARAATCYWRAGEFIGRSISLVNRASLLNGMGCLSASADLFREARSAANSADRKSTVLRACLGIGWVAARGGRINEARGELLAAWRDSRKLAIPREEALALEYLAEAYLLSNRLANARIAIRMCKRLAERIAPEGDIALEIKIKEAMLFLAEGRARGAVAMGMEAVRHAKRVGMPWEEAQAQRVVGTARLYAGGKKQRARSAFARAHALLSDMGEQLERPVVEAWLEALDRPKGWLPREAADPAGASSPAETDPGDAQAAAIRFWLQHPLLGPYSWLRMRAAIAQATPAAAGPQPEDGSSGASTAESMSARTRADQASAAPIPSSKAIHPVWAELGLVTRTPELIEILRLAETYAAGTIPVLILGETGTGKDLVAQGLHTLSGRTGRLVPVNCAAAHRELFAAELFGARRGAYTGATEGRHGLIREAEGGTLFLDEIADLDGEAQGFMLRFLDSGEVRPLGESRRFHVETRVVAATCRSLHQMVAQGSLRRDLYARLAAAVLEIPPLRERVGDLELLIATLWKRHGGSPSDHKRIFSAQVVDALRSRAWPGNVRDLSHAVAQAVLFVRAGESSAAVDQLLDHAGRGWDAEGRTDEDTPSADEEAGDQAPRVSDPPGLCPSCRRPAAAAWVEELPPPERRSASTLRRALAEAGGSVAKAATILGISRAHAYRLYRHLGLG